MPLIGQFPQLHPQDDFPFFLLSIPLTIMATTTIAITEVIVIVSQSIKIPPVTYLKMILLIQFFLYVCLGEQVGKLTKQALQLQILYL